MSGSVITIRKGCRFCKEPHPCNRTGICPSVEIIGGKKRMSFSINRAVQILKEMGIDISESLIKYYDEIGLVSPEKTSGGHRRIDEKCLKQIIFIKTLRKYGFNLNEIKYFIEVVKSKDLKEIEKIFGNIRFYEDDFLIEKHIDNYSKSGDSSLYWWSDFGSGPSLQEKAQKRSTRQIVWGYVYKNCSYDKDKDIYSYRMYLYPEKPEPCEARIKKLLDFAHLYILNEYDIDPTKDHIGQGSLDRFSLWVDDRKTGSNKLIKARINLFTYLKSKDFKGPENKEGVSIYYDFEINDKEKLDYEDCFLVENYINVSEDGMHRIFM